ncbi:MAG TPA: short-chain dehydrogenase, partial [Acidimicrobiaceae bacterium]|nr:short-chain dehydrogenase [Acidimicrobiaceae bacterium]
MAIQPADIRLDGTVAVVTGAAQGIGAACARALGAFGASVALIDRKSDQLGLLTKELESSGVDVVSTVGDVRDSEARQELLSAVRSKFGVVHTLVNNAGGGFVSDFIDLTEKGQAALIAENFTQVADWSRAIVPLMSEGGSIVNITSIEAHRAGPGFSIYSAMKAAVENLSKTLALELSPLSIRVNCVAPDMIPTEGDSQLIADSGALGDSDAARHPSLVEASVDDAAAAVVFLASSMSRFIVGSSL